MAMQSTNKTFLIVGVIIVVIAVSAIVYQQTKQENAPTASNNNNMPLTNGNAATGNTNAPAPSTNSSDGTLPDDFPKQPDTYQIAIDNYNKGKLLQFENCEARPILPMFVFTGGTEIMLDGKSSDPQTVYIFGKTIELQGLDFELITVPKVTSAKTYNVDCSVSGTRSYNIAKIVVQP